MKLIKFLLTSFSCSIFLCSISYAEITTQTTDIELNGKVVGSVKILTPVELITN